MPWITGDDGEDINLDDLNVHGPDEDVELDCGCIASWDHGAWDEDISEPCPAHTFADAVRIAETPPTRP